MKEETEKRKVSKNETKKKENLFVISLGGSIIVPKEIDTIFLSKFKEIILKEVKENNSKFIIVCGGGYTARKYIEATKSLGSKNNDELDWIGIHATYINASIVKSLFGKYSYEYIINNPTTNFVPDKNIIIASGWKPGFSTDMDAVLLAKQFKVNKVFNISNIDYVHSEDPKENSKATKFEKISWEKYLEIIGEKWDAGRSTPFDPVASKEAMKNKIKVIMVKGNIDEVKKIVSDNKINGTIIGE